MTASVAITRVNAEELPVFISLIRALESEAHPRDKAAAERAARGVYQSLQRLDFTRSDVCWMLLARVAGMPVGYASLVRIPKAGARSGYLFVDELVVLEGFRRAGVASALLAHVEGEARALGVAGLRLLVRPQNEAARALYRKAGFSESGMRLSRIRISSRLASGPQRSRGTYHECRTEKSFMSVSKPDHWWLRLG